jgi:hypothetical protein
MSIYSAVLPQRRSKRNFGEYALLEDSCNASPAKNFSSRIFPSAQALRASWAFPYDYCLTTLLTTYRIYTRLRAALLIEGVF